METTPDPELVYSSLNTLITDDDGVRAVEIYIYRTVDSKTWALEVVNHENTSWVWEDEFESEQDAMNEVRRALHDNGMDVFYQPYDDDDDAA